MPDAHDSAIVVWCAVGDEGGGVAESLEPIHAAFSKAGLALHVLAVRAGRFVDRAHGLGIPTTVVSAGKTQTWLFNATRRRFAAVMHPALGRWLFPRRALVAALPADIASRTCMVLFRSLSVLSIAAYVARRTKCSLTLWYAANATRTKSRWTGRAMIYRYLRRRYGFHVLANSRYTADTFAFFDSSVPWAYIPLSRDFRTTPTPIAESERVFLSIGRVTPNKGQRELLRAFHQYRDEGGTWGMWFVGLVEDNNYSQALIADIHASNYADAIRTFSYSETPRVYIERARVTIVGQRTHEPFGQVAAQAFATGRPIIGVGQGGFRELLDLTRFGWATDAWSSPAIAACMHAAESSHDLTHDRALKTADGVQSAVGLDPLIRAIAELRGEAADVT